MAQGMATPAAAQPIFLGAMMLLKVKSSQGAGNRGF